MTDEGERRDRQAARTGPTTRTLPPRAPAPDGAAEATADEGLPDAASAAAVVHELKVHQAELEAQNRQLREAHALLEGLTARYSDLFEFAPVGYCITGRDGNVVRINYCAAALLGRRADQILGRPLAGWFEAADRRLLRALLQASSDVPRGLQGEFTLVDARLAHVRVLVSCSGDSEGEGGYRVSLMDVSGHRRLQTSWRLLSDAGALLATSLHYLKTLPALLELLVHAYAGEASLHLGDADEVPPLSLRAMAQGVSLQRRRGGAAARAREAELLASGRAEVMASARPLLLGLPASFGPRAAAAPLSAMVVPILLHERVLGTLALVAPPSAPYVAANLELAVALAHRVSLAVDCGRQHAALRRAIGAREAFMGMVSHDLKNMLGTILLKSDMLGQAVARGQPQQMAARSQAIHAMADRMDRLMDDLLDIASIEAGHLSVRPAACAVQDLLAEAVDGAERLAAARQVAVALTVPPGAWVRCDRQRTFQVLANLLSNAIKFTAPGGRVELGAFTGSSKVTFWVHDHGPGIEEAALPHVFDMFWQAGQAGSGGRGLGLAIAKGVIVASGGTIWADSVPGEGASFYFTLPLSAPAPAAAAAAGAPQCAGAAAAAPLLLVVDDDAAVRDAAADALGGAGYAVETACNGRDGLGVARRGRLPSLILLDLSMPVLDGWGFLAACHEDRSLRDIPVLVISGDADAAGRLAGSRVTLLPKPFSRASLLKRVQQVL